MAYWLLKSEPESFSIDDLRQKPNGIDAWDGIRSYQARNFLKTMQLGEIAQLHGFEKIAGLIAANAIPSVYAVRLLPQIINAKGLRFRFQKPVGHLKLSALSKQAL